MRIRSILSLGTLSLIAAINSCSVDENSNGSHHQLKMKEASGEQLRFAEAPATCKAGVDGFSKTVYPLVRDRCTSCHDPEAWGEIHGPPFASKDVNESYSIIKKFVDFKNIPESVFVVKGAKMTRTTPASELQAVTQAWWDQGEKTCDKSLPIKSGNVAIPSPLPDKKTGFARVRLDMSKINPDYTGLFFELEIQRLVEPTPGHQGSYMVQRPRFFSTKGNWRVKQFQVLLNESSQVGANVFLPVDADVVEQTNVDPNDPIWSSPAVSTGYGVLLETDAKTDQLKFTFGSIEKATPITECKDLDGFKNGLLPVYRDRGCLDCHNSASTRTDPMAVKRFDLGGEEKTLCLNSARQIYRANISRSPLIWYPVHGRPVHPYVIYDPSEVLPTWQNWLAKQK